MKQYTAERPVRSTKRSDGTVKVYGWTNNGELMTTVMKLKQNKTPKENGCYDIVEIKVAGKVTMSK